jgi:hypothetical protein
VSREFATAIQRDSATPDQAGDLKVLAELWDNSVIQRLADAKGRIAKDPETAYIILSHALEFLERALDAVDPSHPTWLKLRIVGRSIDGIKSVIADRLKGGGGATDVKDDLRSWYREAMEIGPGLTVGPRGQKNLGTDKLVELWNEGVVFPIGRTILKAAGDKTDEAGTELIDALEILLKWREAAPRGDVRWRLIALERALLFSYKRLDQKVRGASEVDVTFDLDTALQDATVLGSLLASAPPKPAPPPPAAPSTKPFVNDTELMRPGD